LRYEDLATDEAGDDPDEPEIDTLIAEYMSEEKADAGIYPDQGDGEGQRRDTNLDALKEAFPALKEAPPFYQRMFRDAYQLRDAGLAFDILERLGHGDDQRADATRPNEDPKVEASDLQPEKQRKGDVGYVNSSPGSEVCEDCGWYQPAGQSEETGSCLIVRGGIAPSGWCRLWGTVGLAPSMDRADAYRTDPYSGASDESLPDQVQEMSETKREKWVSVFNEVFSANADLTAAVREEKAFRVAYAEVNDE